MRTSWKAYLDKLAEKRRPSFELPKMLLSAAWGAIFTKRCFAVIRASNGGWTPLSWMRQCAARIPVRLNRDDRYFSDTYQAMPLQGFTRMFENMLDHPNITIVLNTDYRDVLKSVRYRELVYTGPVDEFFDYRFGKLPYRSLQVPP